MTNDDINGKDCPLATTARRAMKMARFSVFILRTGGKTKVLDLVNGDLDDALTATVDLREARFGKATPEDVADMAAIVAKCCGVRWMWNGDGTGIVWVLT